jgi:hypothetical protein
LVLAGVFATDDVTTSLRPACRRISRQLYCRWLPYNNNTSLFSFLFSFHTISPSPHSCAFSSSTLAHHHNQTILATRHTNIEF